MALFISRKVLFVFFFTVIFCNEFSKALSYDSSDSFEDNSIDDLDLESRILNGLMAKARTYPYMVSLQTFDTEAESVISFCGGVIIRPKWILTAAHCMFETFDDGWRRQLAENKFRIKAGSVEAYADGSTDQFVNVSKIILHPKYCTKGFVRQCKQSTANDIALLMLEHPLKYNKYVRRIALPPAHYSAKGNGTAIGWGFTDRNQTILSEVLRYITLPVSNRSECVLFYENEKITKKKLCVGSRTQQTACAGDSGGPFIQTINGKPTVVGIFSYGSEGCYESDPIVYTNVASYLKFIKKYTKDTNKNTEPKILNDKNMDFPYLAAIMEYNDNIYEKICTGVIIESQFVLTTADCFDNRGKAYLKYIRVKVGSIEIDDTNKGELYEVQKVRRHPNYYLSDRNMKDNLAVIQLKMPFKLSSHVVKPFLPPNFFNLESIQGEIIGWNLNGSTLSNNLIISSVRNGNPAICKHLYPTASDSEICIERTNNVCNQDSGSPLIVKAKNGNFLIGLNSFFNKCENNQPFLVANILDYYMFFDDVFNDVIRNKY